MKKSLVWKPVNRHELTKGTAPVDIRFIIRQRLEQLGLEQTHLAVAAQVTGSYISQLLTRRRAPPAPDRTDIYGKIEGFLKLPNGELAKLAELQRHEELKRKLGDPPVPLFKEVRELVLRKCKPGDQEQVRTVFEKQPFGELELLVTQKLLDVAKGVARHELESANWLRLVRRFSNRSYEEMRVAILEFLDTDIFNVSIENCASVLDPLIQSWDIDLATFSPEIVLNRRVAPGEPKKFAFVEKQPESGCEEEPALKEFLGLAPRGGSVTEEEIEYLKRLRFEGRYPTPVFYYRELQSLRDPLHFRGSTVEEPGTSVITGVLEHPGRAKAPLAS
jgi:transcriptional regulator with XRE-family HTH domain